MYAYFQITLIALTIVSFANTAPQWSASTPAYQEPAAYYYYQQQPQVAPENYIKRSSSEFRGYAAPATHQSQQEYQPGVTGYTAPVAYQSQPRYQPAVAYENYEQAGSALAPRVYTRAPSSKAIQSHQIQPSISALQVKHYANRKPYVYKAWHYY